MPLRRRMGWGNLISYSRCGRKKTFLQGEKNTGGKSREGLFQVKQHPMSFIDSADDIIFTTEPGV